MKRLPHCLLPLLVFLLPVIGFSQARFTITAIQGFPWLPADTAYEGTVYDSILVTITNTGSQSFTGEMDILIQANPGITDTLLLDSNGTATYAPGVSISFRSQPYVFTTTHFDGGDNIIVVWPQARFAPPGTMNDTLTGEIYFITFLGTGDSPATAFEVYPNPASQYLGFRSEGKSSLKQVRIYDISGQLVFRSSHTDGLLYLKDWDPGLYFIEATFHDGKKLMRKLIKY